MTQQLPEVHIIGEILEGYQFKSKNAFVKFNIESGKEWDCAEGDESGQTQVDYSNYSNYSNYPRWFKDKYIWNHPIDLHYFIKSIQGWPKIIFQVGNLDDYGSKQVCMLKKYFYLFLFLFLLY